MTNDAPGRAAVHGSVRIPRLVWGFLWAMALAALYTGSASVALKEPDEGRNAEVAREMIERGDFVVPHLNGLPYLDKPVFFFASAATAIAALGPTEFAARLPSLFFTLATVLLLGALARSRFDSDTALLAGLMLATSPLALAFSRIVIFDATMMFWVSASCIAFHLGWTRESRLWPVLGWAAAGFAVLTKGPVGLVLPLLIGIAEALACGHRLRRMFHPGGLLVFLLVVAPWFFAVTARQPEFPHYAFVRETFERVATDRMKRTAGVHYIPAWLIGGSLPWVVLLLAGWPSLRRYWSERRGRARTEVFLLLWILVPLLFFTLSQSKRPGYILVSLPAVALLSTRILLDAPRVVRPALWTGGIVAASVGALLLFGSGEIAGRVHGEAIAGAIRSSGPVAGLAMLLASAIAFYGLRDARFSISGLAAIPAALVLGLQGVLGVIGDSRSAREVARAIEAEVPGDAVVVAVGTYPASLSYYLRRAVLVTTDDGTAIRSNYIEEYHAGLRGQPGSTLRPADWWRGQLATCPEPTVFVVDTRSTATVGELAAQLPALHDTGRYAAYGPCAPTPR